MGDTLILAGQAVTAGELNRIYGESDTNTTTVIASTYANLSSSYTISAGDADASTAYRLTCGGNGTWATSGPQTIQFANVLAGNVVGQAPILSASCFSTSAAFDFEVQIKLVCASTGSSGTWIASIRGILTQTANSILPGTAADNTVSFTGITSSVVTQDTTVDNTLAVQCKWGSATGSPTLTTRYTLYERVN